MGPDAGAAVVITDAYNPDLLTAVRGQPGKIEPAFSGPPGDKFFLDRKTGCDHRVYLFFDPADFRRAQLACEVVVALGFLSFNVSTETPPGSKKPDHGLVEDVLGRVHVRIELFLHNVPFSLHRAECMEHSVDQLLCKPSAFQPFALRAVPYAFQVTASDQLKFCR